MSSVVGAQPTQEEGSFAVVELFTSEGCSSCPAADDVLAELAVEASRTGLPIYPIAWHVDYWNYLGWTDPYSNAENTRRQQLYAARLPSQVYTPQMVVNGRRIVRPAQRLANARTAVRTEMTRAQGYAISLNPNLQDRNLTVEYSLESVPPGATIGIVVVESGLSNHVKRGENAGRILTHINTARAAAWDSARSNGTLNLTLPADLVIGNARIIALLQNSSDLQIVGANEVSL